MKYNINEEVILEKLYDNHLLKLGELSWEIFELNTWWYHNCRLCVSWERIKLNVILIKFSIYRDDL